MEPNIDGCNDCWNFLTINRKIHEKRKNFEDFTMCWRFNILSYRGVDKASSAFRLRAEDHFKVMTKSGGELWWDSNIINAEYNYQPPGNAHCSNTH